MSIHSEGTGSGWNETLDANQSHGLDYRELNDFRIGIRKRIGKEHIDPADNTIGGNHVPGGCSVLGMDITNDCTAGVKADGTYIGKGLVWALSDTSNYGVLFCATGDGTAPSLDWTVLRMHPNLQWGGRDVTWTGSHQFDATVCFTTAEFQGDVSIVGGLTCASDVDITSRLSCYSEVDITGFLKCGSSAYFANDVSCKADLVVDGTLHVAGQMDVSGNCDISGTLNVTRIAGSQAPTAWARVIAGTGVLKTGYNIAHADKTATGIYCISFTSAKTTADYAQWATVHDPSAWQCGIISTLGTLPTGFYTVFRSNSAVLTDPSEYSVIVFGG